MFRKAKNIDSAFRMMRLLALVAVAGSTVFSLTVSYWSFMQTANQSGKIYLLANGQILEAESSDQNDPANIRIEAEGHIANFHRFFFTLMPDERYIERTIDQALALADKSAKQQYDILRERNYFVGIISGNVTQTITIDSISVDLTVDPWQFSCYAHQDITRSTSEVVRILITEGALRRVERSPNNQHGFKIEKWKIVDNKDVSIKKR